MRTPSNDYVDVEVVIHNNGRMYQTTTTEAEACRTYPPKTAESTGLDMNFWGFDT